MPVIHSTTLRSPFWLPDGHFQSIYPSLFRKIALPYVRERITTPDDDFLDLDWLCADGLNHRLVILSHGLEGSSTRQYVTGMARLMSENNYDVLAWNYRSCSEELNRQARFYHSGETTDLQLVINHAIAKGYTDICLMGFSLGGNLTLKYVGEQGAGINPVIKKAVVFSVPMDLAACSTASRRIGFIYGNFYAHSKPKSKPSLRYFQIKSSLKTTKECVIFGTSTTFIQGPFMVLRERPTITTAIVPNTLYTT
jgi:uncharacterized protein